MTTLQDRPNTALLVIDAQRDVLAGTHDRDAVVANITGLVDAARASDTSVVWVQQTDDRLVEGGDGWQLAAPLRRREIEPVILKQYPDAFDETDLEDTLHDRGIGRLIVVGAQTDECIRSTLHGAIVRGYDAVLVSDAHTTEDLTEWGAPPPGQVIAHTNLYWGNHEAPGRTAGTVAAADVEFTTAATGG